MAAEIRKCERCVDRQKRTIALFVGVLALEPFLVEGDEKPAPQAELITNQGNERIALAAIFPILVPVSLDDALVKLGQREIGDYSSRAKRIFRTVGTIQQ